MYIYVHTRLWATDGTHWLPYWLLRAVSAASCAFEDGGYARAEERQTLP